jgi:hypothetical protein
MGIRQSMDSVNTIRDVGHGRQAGALAIVTTGVDDLARQLAEAGYP